MLNSQELCIWPPDSARSVHRNRYGISTDSEFGGGSNLWAGMHADRRSQLGACHSRNQSTKHTIRSDLYFIQKNKTLLTTDTSIQCTLQKIFTFESQGSHYGRHLYFMCSEYLIYFPVNAISRPSHTSRHFHYKMQYFIAIAAAAYTKCTVEIRKKCCILLNCYIHYNYICVYVREESVFCRVGTRMKEGVLSSRCETAHWQNSDTAFSLDTAYSQHY